MDTASPFSLYVVSVMGFVSETSLGMPITTKAVTRQPRRYYAILPRPAVAASSGQMEQHSNTSRLDAEDSNPETVRDQQTRVISIISNRNNDGYNEVK